MGIVSTEGAAQQLDTLLGTIYGQGTVLWLSDDSHTIAGSDSYPPVPLRYIQLNPVSADLDYTDWTVTSDSTGATATLSDQSIVLLGGAASTTLTQWWIQLGGDSVWYWAGSLSPPYTYTGASGVVGVGGITVTLGQCPSPPSPTTLLSDTFSGVGSSPLGSDAPQIGGPWTVLEGTIVAGNGQCSASSSGLIQLAATPQGSASVTVTVGYTAGTSVVADVVDAVAYGTPSTTYVSARAGQGQLRLVTAEGGSTTYTTTVPISYTAGDSYTLTLEVVDQVATAYWQGQPLAAVGPTGLDCSDSVGLGFEALFGTPSSVIHSIVVTTP